MANQNPKSDLLVDEEMLKTYFDNTKPIITTTDPGEGSSLNNGRLLIVVEEDE